MRGVAADEQLEITETADLAADEVIDDRRAAAISDRGSA